MRTFTVHRSVDVSGVSGTGTVAEGVEFHDGQVAVSWFGQHHILEVAKDVKTWLAVHGHGGSTYISWHDMPVMSGTTSEVTIKIPGQE